MARLTRHEAQMMLARLEVEQRYLDEQIRRARRAMSDYIAGR